ncbi:hook domain-containing protein [Nannochloropsis oceanica]
MITKEEEDTTATAEALVQWINSFGPLPPGATSPSSAPPPLIKLEQLTDGLVLADVLHDIAPTRFPRDLLARPLSSSAASTPTTPTANWALALTNLKKLMRLLEAHYEEELGLHLHGGRGGNSYFASLDLAGIAREKRNKDIIRLVELVVLAAVRAPAPEKARAYIERIMGLSPEAQAFLKESVEKTLQRATSFVSSTSPSSSLSSSFLDTISSATSSSFSSSLPSSFPCTTTAASTALAADQQRENAHLHETIQELQLRLAKAEEEVLVVREEARGWKGEVEGQRHRLTAAVARAEEAQKASEKWRVRLEAKELEGEHWRQEARRWEDRVKGERERADRAEEGRRRLADEVDVLREKADAAHDLEQILEKYKLRLEQAAMAKQHYRDLEEQNAKYLDQVLALEAEAKASVPSLKRAIEQYKDQVVGLERDRYQAMERREVMEGELERAKEEVEGAREARRFLMEECQELKRVVQQLHLQQEQPQGSQEGQPQLPGGGRSGEEERDEGGLALFEDAWDNKEKLLRLERENRMLRKQMEDGGWPRVGEGEDILLLKSQMQDLRRVKEEREAEAIAAKKRTAELEGNVAMLRGQCEEMEEEVGRMKEEGVGRAAAAAAAAVEGKEKALARVQLLLQQEKEWEEQVLRLKGEKDRLEEYAKKTLRTVQEKYVQTLGDLKGSNTEYKARNQALEARLLEDRQAQKREEKLLMSCVYGIGMEMLQSERREGGRKG